MQTAVYLPRLELTMDNVRVAAIQVRVGDQVSAAQPLIEVETEKAVQIVPSPKRGYVRKLFVQTEDQLYENALICVLTDTAEESFEEPRALELDAKGRGPMDDANASNSDPSVGLDSATEGIRAAPAARKLARDLDIDLQNVAGTGPGGRITVADVQRIRDESLPSRSDSHWESLSPMRLALISQMQKSLSEIPQFHVARLLNTGPLQSKAGGFSFTARLVRCTARALETHPRLRTVLLGEKVRVAPLSIAVAMQTQRGVLAPVLRTPDLGCLEDISSALRNLRARAEAGTLRREELGEAPFAISNLGRFHVDFFHPFVFHGQTAVMGVGRSVGGKAWFSLAADHRVVDGTDAAQFLDTLQKEISLA